MSEPTPTITPDVAAKAEELAEQIAGIEFKYCKAEHLGNLGIWRREDAAEAQIILAKAALQGAFSAGVEASVKECDRHEKFCKDEARKGGDFKHLITRCVEAAYNAQRIRALKLPDGGK